MQNMSPEAYEYMKMKQRERSKKFRQEHPDKVREYNARYWEKKFREWRAEQSNKIAGNSENLQNDAIKGV